MQKEGRVKKLEFFSHVLPFLISNVRDQELPTMIPTDCSQAYSHDPIISPSRHHKFPLQPPVYKQVL